MSSSILSKLMKWCRVSRDGDDAGDFPILQVSYLGKVGKAGAWFPYGFHANVPAGTIGFLGSIQGNPENRVVFPSSPKQRPKVEVGEVVVYHPKTGSKVFFKDNGDVQIKTSDNEVLITKSGDISVTPAAGQVLRVVGNLEVSGTLDVQGASATLPAFTTSAGINIGSTHKHTGSPTAPSGVISNTGAPV